VEVLREGGEAVFKSRVDQQERAVVKKREFRVEQGGVQALFQLFYKCKDACLCGMIGKKGTADCGTLRSSEQLMFSGLHRPFSTQQSADSNRQSAVSLRPSGLSPHGYYSLTIEYWLHDLRIFYFEGKVKKLEVRTLMVLKTLSARPFDTLILHAR
jgi:hypothetical protein